MYVFFSWINIILTTFLQFLMIKLIDIVKYFINKEYKVFKGYGLHIYTGIFGSGKTSTMVYDAYRQACRYPQLTILSNMKLKHFPKHTKIIDLENYLLLVCQRPIGVYREYRQGCDIAC
jgi:hypothetical protein